MIQPVPFKQTRQGRRSSTAQRSLSTQRRFESRISTVSEAGGGIGTLTPGAANSTAVDSVDYRQNAVWRKTLHISPGVLAFLLPWLPHTKPLSGQSLFEITAITVALTGLYIALKHRVERPNETDFYLTTLSYPVAILGMLFAYPAAPELAIVVLVVLAFGDGSACLAGRLVGGRPLPWNRDKTWAGTAAFAVIGGTLASLAYGLEAGAASTWLAAILCGGATAVVGAVAESLPARLSDNVRVGFAASATVAVMHFFVVPAWL